MSKQSKVLAYVGIGSNLDDPVQQVEKSISLLRQSTGCVVNVESSFYLSEPWGLVNQPQFINAVCRIETTLSPNDLLEKLLHIESLLGRQHSDLKYGPRRIDLDLLLYGELTLNSQALILPHPRMHLRRFVLEPLFQIDRTIKIPGKGLVSELLLKCKDQGIQRISH